MGEFRMPSLGADMDSGSILEWRVQPGQTVRRGDIVAVVDTEKSDIEIEVFEDGVVEELLVEPGVEVPVGTVLARIATGADGDARPSAAEPGSAPAPAPARAPAIATDRPPDRAPGERVGFVRATPRARRQAEDAGVDLSQVAGSGPGGAVVASDLEAVVTPDRASDLEAVVTPDRASDRRAGLRHAIGELMARSKREIPHYYLATTVDLGAALDWLARTNTDRGVSERVLPAALLLKATALAARQVPAVNGFWRDGFEPSSSVHLGVAVSLRGGGLVAPAIHDADQLPLGELMQALRDLVQRARGGGLRGSEMSDPTITVTNLGDQGVEDVFGVIYPPQVALVGFGKIVERPWASSGMLGIRPVVRATLSADHRVSDGHDGAAFLAALDHLLQHPEEL